MKVCPCCFKFAQNMNEIVKKVNSRLLCLYKLRSFHVKTEILQTFYTATIRSVFSYGAICWGGNLPEREKNKIEKIIKRAGSAIGKKQPSFEIIYSETLWKRTSKIINDDSHPLHDEIVMRINESGRIRQLDFKSQRYQHSFLPRAISCYNEHHSRGSSLN